MSKPIKFPLRHLQVMRYSSQLQDCRRLLEEQRAFLKGAGCSQTFQSILANFKAAGNIPALTTNSLTTKPPNRHNSDRQNRGVGFARLRKILWRNGSAGGKTFYEERIGTADHRHLKIIHEAICNTGYPITRFELGCGGLAKLPIKLDKFRRANTPFANLKMLNFTFKPVRGVEQSQKRLKAITEYLVAVLRVAKSLETLKLALSSSYGKDKSSFLIFQTIVRQMTSSNKHSILNNIQDLHLHRFGYHFEDVLAFLSATRSSLKRFQITDEPMWEMGESPVGPPWKDMVLQANGSKDLELLGHVWTDDPKMSLFRRLERRKGRV